MPKIQLRNISKGKSVLDEVGIFGEIKNTGNRTLQKVEVIIYCLGDSGERIYEKGYYPILVSDSSISMDPDKPLKPNYSKKFGCKLDDAPEKWSGRVEVVIKDLEFSQ